MMVNNIIWYVIIKRITREYSTAVNIQITEIVTRLKWQGSTWDTEITVESFYNLKTNSFCGQTKLFAHWWRYFSSSFYVEFCVFAKICQLIILLQKYTNVISKMTWLCINVSRFDRIQINSNRLQGRIYRKAFLCYNYKNFLGLEFVR